MRAEARLTREWVEHFVVRLQLCPFAARPLLADRVTFTVTDHSRAEDVFYWAGSQVQSLLSTDAAAVSTVLLIAPRALSSFAEFLDLVGALEEFLERSGAVEYIQLAHFHPHYVFAGSDPGDPANRSNRSPYPTVQLLRTEEVAAAVAHHADVDGIPQRNIDLLRELAADEGAGGLAADGGDR